MSRIEELIKELCPDGVVYKSLGEILKNNNASDSVSKKDYKEVGKIPIIDQSQSYIAAYTDNESAVPPAFPCIIFGDHTRVLKYADKKFAQGDSGTKVFIPVSKNTNTKYIYYAFCNLNIPSRGYNRHWSIVKDIEIPLPPLPVQQEIVRILDNFTELTAELKAELTAELAARKKQYEYYRDELLTFEDDIQLKTLGKLCGTITTGRLNANAMVQGGKYPFFTCDSTPFRIDEYAFDTTAIIVSGNGSQVGHINYYEGKFNAYQRTYVLSDFLGVNKAYLYFYLKAHLRKYIIVHSKKGSVPYITMPMLQNFKVPIPADEKQEQVITILKRFDALCNDLTSGLPAEIEARKKQYEYYRDKLLTFKEASA